MMSSASHVGYTAMVTGDPDGQEPRYPLISSVSRWLSWPHWSVMVPLGGYPDDSAGWGGAGARRSLGMSRSGSGWARVGRMFQSGFRAVRITVGRVAKQRVPFSVRKPPEIFWPSLSILRSLFASLLVNGIRASYRKRRHSE